MCFNEIRACTAWNALERLQNLFEDHLRVCGIPQILSEISRNNLKRLKTHLKFLKNHVNSSESLWPYETFWNTMKCLWKYPLKPPKEYSRVYEALLNLLETTWNALNSLQQLWNPLETHPRTCEGALGQLLNHPWNTPEAHPNSPETSLKPPEIPEALKLPCKSRGTYQRAYKAHQWPFDTFWNVLKRIERPLDPLKPPCNSPVSLWSP